MPSCPSLQPDSDRGEAGCGQRLRNTARACPAAEARTLQHPAAVQPSTTQSARSVMTSVACHSHPDACSNPRMQELRHSMQMRGAADIAGRMLRCSAQQWSMRSAAFAMAACLLLVPQPVHSAARHVQRCATLKEIVQTSEHRCVS